jgi:16S rRNA (guanine527-N7)-methyltransferase
LKTDSLSISGGSMPRPSTVPDPGNLIRSGAEQLGISLSEDALRKMLRHLDMVRTWTRRVRLISRKSARELAILHFLDSLNALNVIPARAGLRILDIGSGGGFPGLVLKTARESFHLTLLEKDLKKTVFLKLVASELGLSDVVFLNESLESVLAMPGARTFDVIVSRAFSSDPALLDRLAVLLEPGGLLLRMAGPASRMENLDLSRFSRVRIWEGPLPHSDRFRRLILYARTDPESG